MIGTYRPGPDQLAPGLCPGGIIVHVYTLSGRRLIEQSLAPDANVETAAAIAAEQSALTRGPVCLVAFDGDTGARFSAREWAL